MSREERRRYRNEIDFLNDRLDDVLNELSQARAELSWLQQQNRTLHRQIAALNGHPCAVNGWLSGTQFLGGRPKGGDDERVAVRWGEQ